MASGCTRKLIQVVVPSAPTALARSRLTLAVLSKALALSLTEPSLTGSRPLGSDSPLPTAWKAELLVLQVPAQPLPPPVPFRLPLFAKLSCASRLIVACHTPWPDRLMALAASMPPVRASNNQSPPRRAAPVVSWLAATSAPVSWARLLISAWPSLRAATSQP